MAHEISLANFGGGEGIRDSGLLKSALARPKNQFPCGNPGIHELAAAYTAGIVQSHPFVDGNKRTGFLAGAAFLELNGWVLTASEPDATKTIFGLAAGEVTEAELADWFERNSEKSVP
jgi:death-on-curing protein